MTLFDPNWLDPDVPLCEKHHFKGYYCHMCHAEEISNYESIKSASFDLANKLEGLLIACKTTNAHTLFPYSFEDATKSLEVFKDLMK